MRTLGLEDKDRCKDKQRPSVIKAVLRRKERFGGGWGCFLMLPVHGTDCGYEKAERETEKERTHTLETCQFDRETSNQRLFHPLSVLKSVNSAACCMLLSSLQCHQHQLLCATKRGRSYFANVFANHHPPFFLPPAHVNSTPTKPVLSDVCCGNHCVHPVRSFVMCCVRFHSLC